MGGAERFGGAGYEDEGDVGQFLAEEGELGEKVAAHAAGSWGVSGYDEREEMIDAHIETKRLQRTTEYIERKIANRSDGQFTIELHLEQWQKTKNTFSSSARTSTR